MTTTHKPNWTLAVGIPFCIFLFCFFITRSTKFTINNEAISNAILFDLLITAPLVYFITIRKTTVSKLTVIRVFIVGLLVAVFILNNHSNIFLHIIKTWVSPAIEGLVIFFIAQKFYAANKIAKENNSKVDFLMHCRNMMHQVMGNEKLGNIIASEISVFYYAFVGKKSTKIDYKSTFTSYKENGLLLVLSAILGLFLIETAGVHLIINLWNSTIAWVLTGLSIYTCMQLFAHIRAIKARPIVLSENSIDIHNGLAGDAYISFANIEKIEGGSKLPQNKKGVKIALLKELENYNVIIYLKAPIEVTKIFGIKKNTDTVLFFVDKPNDFLNAVNTKMILPNNNFSL
jgi:hypothetical protein